MDNPAFLIVLIFLACASLITGAVLAANFYRRREAGASARREAARLDDSDRAASYVPVNTQPAAVHHSTRAPQAAPSRYDARPVQQTVVHDNSGADLVNLLLMQQALNSIGHEHHHEDRSEEHHGSRQEESQEYTPEPAAQYVEPAYTAPEPVSYSAPEPAYTAPEPVSYAPDPTPSYDSSPSYSDSGSFGGGDSGSF